MTDAALTGRRVLDALARGRRRAIEFAQARGALTRRTVLHEAREDERRGLPARGRAVRIARRLHGLVTERQIRNILAEALSSVSDSVVHDAVSQQHGTD